MRTIQCLVVLLLMAAATIGAAELDGSPRLVEVVRVVPGVLRIEVRHGAWHNPPIEVYQAQDGDVIETTGNGERFLRRGGQRIGGITGPDLAGDLLFKPYEIVVRDDWSPEALFVPGNLTISSADHPAYASPLSPVQVHRKSKVDHFRRWTAGWPPGVTLRHVAYLVLPEPLQEGASYHLDLGAAGLGTVTMEVDTTASRSEAVVVNHLGFRPDDPRKHGFLSLWMGTGGRHDVADGLPFQVLDDASGTVVFSGTAVLARRWDQQDGFEISHARADVHRLDFSALTAPGRYRLHVPGFGCSYPFTLGHQATWHQAARSALRGLYHHRSGIPHLAEHSECGWTRPRNFHPDDGVVIRQSTATWCVPPAANERGDIFAALVAGETEQQVLAWGGYHDAGDWDRRPQHIPIAYALFTLWELNPTYWSALRWNIPSDNGLPDLLAEGLWLVDFYARMQRDDGAVRGMIEQEEHPRYPDLSWTESLRIYATAPEALTTWRAAALFAWAARVTEPFDAARAEGYRVRAQSAWAWAEAWLPTWDGDPLHHLWNDARNLAALQLYRLLGEAGHHGIFLTTTAYAVGLSDGQYKTIVHNSHTQDWAALQYHLATERPRDVEVLARARLAIRNSADEWLGWLDLFAWGNGRNPWAPAGWGNLINPQAQPLLLAHAVHGEDKYLVGLVSAVQANLGANPDNRSYVTGLGHDSPENALHIDALHLGVTAPEGIVLYGPSPNWQWSYQYFPEGAVVPEIADWPVGERFMNLGLGSPETNEYTVQQGMGPAAFTWGYLAARSLERPVFDGPDLRCIQVQDADGRPWHSQPPAPAQFTDSDGNEVFDGLQRGQDHLLRPGALPAGDS